MAKQQIRAWIKRQSRTRWAVRLFRAILAFYIWLAYVTARKRFDIHPRTQELLDKKNPFLVGNWHGRLIFFAPFWMRKAAMDFAFISSPHNDGMIMGGAAEILGLRPLRGTRGGQGGAKAVRECLTALKQGSCIGLNPDGPRGPRQVLGEGTALLAQISNVPFVAITYSASRGRILQRYWDRSLLISLFSHITYTVSEPYFFDKSQDREEVRRTIEAIMNAQLWAADAAYGRPKIEVDAS